MIKIFRTNIIQQILIITLVALLMWVRVFVHQTPMPAGKSILYAPIYSLLSKLPLLASILGFVLVVAEGFLFNALLYERKMIPSNTLLPTLVYIVAMSITDEMRTLSPIVISNIFIILTLRQLLLSSSLLSISTEKVFGAALLIAMATLFYTPAILFLVPLLIIFIIYQLYSWRDWVIMILGFLAPFVAIFTYFFIAGKMDGMMKLLVSEMTQLNFGTVQTDILQYAATLFFVLFLVVSLLYLPSIASNSVVAFRKNTAVIGVLTISSLALMPYYRIFPPNCQLFALPIAFSGSIFLLNVKGKEWIWNTMLTLWLVISVCGCNISL